MPIKEPNECIKNDVGSTTFAATMAHVDYLPIPAIKILFVVASTKKVRGTESGLGALNKIKAVLTIKD